MSKKALLMGINRYRDAGSDLRGCVTDVLAVRDILAEMYDFPEENIRTLTDLDASKARMQKEIASLVSGAEPGDVLLIHYSGHGSNVPDKSGDEADFRDEILCPTDLDWRDPLLDDWLRTRFDELPEGASLTVIMDCCHSGTNTRRMAAPDADIVERFLPCPLDLLATESGRELRGVFRGGLWAPTRDAASDVVEVDLPEVLITGCRDDQTSADAYIEGDYRGAMTYALLTTLREAGGQLTYRELHAGATEVLAAWGFKQVPQLEGRAQHLDRPFLSPRA